MGEPTRIGDLLDLIPGLTRRRREADLVRAWPALAGPAARRSRAVTIENGVLTVAVDSSGWLHHLTLQEARLLAHCRQAAPDVPLRAIRFHLAPPSPGPACRRGAASEVQREVS